MDQWLLSWCALLCPRGDDICCLCGIPVQIPKHICGVCQKENVCHFVSAHLVPCRGIILQMSKQLCLIFPRKKNASKFVSGRLVRCLIWFKRCDFLCPTLCPSSLYWDCHIKPRMDTKSVSGHYNTINRDGKCLGLPVVQSSIVVLDLSRDGSCLLFSDSLLVVFFSSPYYYHAFFFSVSFSFSSLLSFYVLFLFLFFRLSLFSFRPSFLPSFLLLIIIMRPSSSSPSYYYHY